MICNCVFNRQQVHSVGYNSPAKECTQHNVPTQTEKYPLSIHYPSFDVSRQKWASWRIQNKYKHKTIHCAKQPHVAADLIKVNSMRTLVLKKCFFTGASNREFLVMRVIKGSYIVLATLVHFIVVASESNLSSRRMLFETRRSKALYNGFEKKREVFTCTH